MAKTLLYTISCGRSGTEFLSRLLQLNIPEAQVHHERAGWLDLGYNCPDASHLTRFNTIGNTAEIRAFWKQKLARDLSEREEIYAEATHLHCKAGIFENIDLVPLDTKIVIVSQRRDPLKIAWSLYNRFDFFNLAFSWIFALDPRYSNVIVGSGALRQFGPAGSAIWYVAEMETRAAYYRRLLAERPNVIFHETALEEITGREGAERLLQAVTGSLPAKVVLPPPANQGNGSMVRRSLRGLRRLSKPILGTLRLSLLTISMLGVDLAHRSLNDAPGSFAAR